MRGGALFNGKEGRGDFRKNPSLRVREDWWVFEKNLRLKGKTVGLSKEIEKLVGFSKKSKEKHIKAN